MASDKAKRWRPWRFSLATLLILTAVVAACLGIFGPPPRTAIAIYIRFPWTINLDKSCEIRKRGILVGRSQKVEILENGDCLLTAALWEDLPIWNHDGFIFVPKSDDLPAFIAISYSLSVTRRAERLQDGDWIEGRVADATEAKHFRLMND